MVQKNNVYEIVAARICEKIQKAIDDGTYLPWQQPWSGKSHCVPRSYVSGKNYNGINRLLLVCTWSKTQFFIYGTVRRSQSSGDCCFNNFGSLQEEDYDSKIFSCL